MKNKGSSLLTIIYLLFVFASCSLEINNMLGQTDDIAALSKTIDVNKINDNAVSSNNKISNTASINNNHVILTSNKQDNDSYFEIEFIDVGQGDAIIVNSDDHYMIVDGGDKYSSDLMYSLLSKKNISYIDYIFATHADADHIGGLSGVLNYCIKNDVKVKNIYCNNSNETDEYYDFIKYSNELGNTIDKVKDGDTFYLKDVRIDVLSCDAGQDNDSSIVLMLTYGNNKILLTGDGENLTEDYLVNSKDIKADLLKVAHHGSNSSTSIDFLNKVNPDYAIISVGENTYGHPTNEVLNRLKEANTTIYRTDYNGNITCSSDRVTIACNVEKEDEFRILDNKKEKTNITRSISQTEFKYILNTNSWKFHYPNCKSVDRMLEENKEYSNASRDEIIEMGYVACKNCNP